MTKNVEAWKPERRSGEPSSFTIGLLSSFVIRPSSFPPARVLKRVCSVGTWKLDNTAEVAAARLIDVRYSVCLRFIDAKSMHDCTALTADGSAL